MKKIIYSTILATGLLIGSGCKKFIDVNTNPNYPEKVAPNLYLPPMLSYMALGDEYDGRYIGKYVQNWAHNSSDDVWDAHGYAVGSDSGGEHWKTTYFTLGQNLVDMINLSEQEQRWDLMGVGQAIKAWGWLTSTDVHGEIIIKEAFNPSQSTFNYDSQEYAYQEVIRLCNEAIKNLARTDGAVSQAYLAKGDRMYGGDRTKWMKFAYGLLAIAQSHLSNKPGYNPQAVIDAVNKSFTSNADDALITFNGLVNDDTNFWGPKRNNLNNFRQTRFAVDLFNGTVFGATDPRISRILAVAPDGQYRGIEPTFGYGALTTTQRPNNLWNTTAATSPAGTGGRYVFDDKGKFPLMTYAELQFIKAEAMYRNNDKAGALAAYKEGIDKHIDFVNVRNTELTGAPPTGIAAPTQITATEKSTFLADTRVVPTDPNQLTLSKIMLQKYIALYGWGFEETWVDMRRYHYTDLDPVTGQQVYVGFAIPPTNKLFADNQGKTVQRLKPRFNSEYVWNREGLNKIGALNPDFHTYEMWLTKK